MKLTQSGTIKVDGYSARRTDEGDWHVSRFETSLGYVDSVDEIQGLITRHKEKVRARLAMAQEKAGRSKAEKVHELALITAATKRGTTETCVDCNRIATHIVDVPWTNLNTNEKGAAPTPFCRAHYPSAEQWPTVTLGV